MFLGEALKFSVQALRANPVRSALTMLGMVIGTASVILVVTISLTSRDYILEQIQGIGSNMIFAYYETGGQSTATSAGDFIKMSDVEAVREQLGGRIVAATGVMTNYDRMLIGGKEQDVAVIGSDQDYRTVRNLVVSAGRFMDASDVALRQKVALLTDQLARAPVRQPHRGRRPDHQGPRAAVHRHRHVSARRWRASASRNWRARPS